MQPVGGSNIAQHSVPCVTTVSIKVMLLQCWPVVGTVFTDDAMQPVDGSNIA